MLYFAYGSNMNQERMKTRKTNFQFRTGAVLKGYELTFNKKAGFSRTGYGSALNPTTHELKARKTLWTDKSKYASSAIKKRTKFQDPEEGYANVIKNPDSEVQGALYVIPEEGLKKLDSCEGFPEHYYREVLEVECANGVVVEAIVYIATAQKQEENLLPTDTYLNHLLKGVDIMTDDYFQKLAKQKTVSEFGNRGYSSTRSGYYDGYYDGYEYGNEYGQYPYTNYSNANYSNTNYSSKSRALEDDDDDDEYWHSRRKRSDKSIKPTKPLIGVD